MQDSSSCLTLCTQWGRSRALCGAYSENKAGIPVDEFVPLTTADVFIWLQDNGHFIRVAPDHAAMRGTTAAELRWCAQCGLLQTVHPLVKMEDDNHRWICTLQTRYIPPPVIRPMTLSISPFIFIPPPRLSPRWIDRDFVQTADPSLVVSVRSLAKHRSPTVLPPSASLPLLLDQLGNSSDAVDKELGPFALIALLVHPMVRTLVRHGLDVASHDALSASVRNEHNDVGPRLLTSAHILRAFGHTDQRHGLAIKAILQRVRPSFPVANQQQVPRVVKMEQREYSLH